MKIIGLIGKSNSGKTSALKYLMLKILLPIRMLILSGMYVKTMLHRLSVFGRMDSERVESMMRGVSKKTGNSKR